MADLLSLALGLAIVVGLGVFVWHLIIWPGLDAIDHRRWAWLVAIIVFTWLAGVLYRYEFATDAPRRRCHHFWRRHHAYWPDSNRGQAYHCQPCCDRQADHDGTAAITDWRRHLT